MKAIIGLLIAITLVLTFSIALFAQDQAESEVQTEVKAPPPPKEEVKNPMVMLETNYGNIKLELFAKEAPISVENFLSYVRDGYYNGTIFHRVIPNFVLQAGGMTEKMEQKPQKAPIKNEAANGLKNLRGTLSMARTTDINSGSSHFFINLRDNTSLDHKGTTPQQYGYAVFGKVADDASMAVVDKIAKVPTAVKRDAIGRDMKDVPVEPVIINKALVIGDEKKPAEKKAEVTAEKPAETKEPPKEVKKEDVKKEQMKMEEKDN
jgi:peptidyl-prolyl cis-trans isomerase A (cyclophilin A)